MAGLLLG